MSFEWFLDSLVLIALIFTGAAMLIQIYYTARGKFELDMIDKSLAIEIERKGRNLPT